MSEHVLEGDFDGRGLRMAIAVSRFNSFITERLLEGCLDGLRRHAVDLQNVSVAWVPGAFEIPVIAHALAKSGKVHAVITLGAVIRGATPHFDAVASQVARGVAQVSADTGVPVIFGVLTTDTIEQAVERAGSKAGNKGFEAAMSAIETARVLAKIKEMA